MRLREGSDIVFVFDGMQISRLSQYADEMLNARWWKFIANGAAIVPETYWEWLSFQFFCILSLLYAFSTFSDYSRLSSNYFARMNVWFRLTLAINKMHNVAHLNFADGRKNSEKLGRISWFEEMMWCMTCTASVDRLHIILKKHTHTDLHRKILNHKWNVRDIM